MKRIFLALALLPIAGCTQTETEPKLGVREETELAKAIEGKVAGEPVSCISGYNATSMRVLGDNTLLYRVNKDFIYINRLQGACRGLAQGDTLVLRRTTSQYCRGDIGQVINLPSGMMSGSCALGDFIPYKTAGK
ncbi:MULTISPECIES: DUF6491 family protein [Sphingobium]|uniref:Lipoprotein n=1 Tax=Sphingobium lignivorans TaxID=2735886 RepID=A0ABR6NAE1_9SPHN|nr:MULTISPECIES: DUF6491 family protein [Sphingobium]MBB5984227.1 hypothetical protein [Sphingobium lignivorans]BAK64906.1 hypothetical protein SLG_02310 [Sphingobium sp. SYK-6]